MTSALEGEGITEIRGASKGGCVKMWARGVQEIRRFCGRHKWEAPYETYTHAHSLIRSNFYCRLALMR